MENIPDFDQKLDADGNLLYDSLVGKLVLAINNNEKFVTIETVRIELDKWKNPNNIHNIHDQDSLSVMISYSDEKAIKKFLTVITKKGYPNTYQFHKEKIEANGLAMAYSMRINIDLE